MIFDPIPGVRVLGIIGHAGAGKDEAASAIAAAVPGARVYGMSDAISVVARVTHGMTTRDRTTLRRLGLEARESDSSVWCRALYWLIDEHRPTLAIITGIRFEDEAQMVREMGGTLLRVRRLNLDLTEHHAEDADSSCATESGVDALEDDGTALNFTGSLPIFRHAVVAKFRHLWE